MQKYFLLNWGTKTCDQRFQVNSPSSQGIVFRHFLSDSCVLTNSQQLISDRMGTIQQFKFIGYRRQYSLKNLNYPTFITYQLMQQKILSFNENKTPMFAKNTNRKYFGPPPADNADMKKSSILFTSHHKEEPNSAHLQSNLYKNNGATSFASGPYSNQNQSSTRKKSQTMYSSMIVQKSETYNNFDGFTSSNNVKQLNDKAQELKKRLLDMAGKKNQKEDLVSKYLKPSSVNNAEVSSPFTKNRKTMDSYNQTSEQSTNLGKLGAFLKPIKKQIDVPKSSNMPLNTQKIDSYTPSFNKKSTFATSDVFNISPVTNPSNVFLSQTPSKAPKQEPKKIRKDDFEIGKKLGNGMFGEVFLVRHKTLRFVCAMKILKKEMVRVQKVQDQLVREIKIQFYLQRQNIINLYGFFYDNDCVYLLQQLCMDGHLFSMLKVKQKFQQVQAADIISQICRGLDYIHHERIIHRDIKPENIIMHQGVAKICDFGWAVYRGDGLRGTYCGTPLYTPPELLRGELYDQKFDIWAIGILAYELIVGRFPFKIFCEDDIKRILTDEITFPFSVDVSADAKNFILSIIRKNPQERIDIEQIMNHPFLRNNSKKAIQIDFKL